MWQIYEKIVRVVCSVFFKIIHKDVNEEQWENILQFFKFCLVGASNSVISYGTNIISLKALESHGIKGDYIIANLIAFIVSVLWSFWLNNNYVFKQQEGEKRSIFKALLKTYLSYGFTGLILTNILSYIWVDILGISKIIAPLINIAICLPINFLLSKLWTFKSVNGEE